MSISSWFRGIRGRLTVLTILPLVLIAVLSYVSYQSVDQLASMNDRANSNQIPKNQAMGEMDSARNGIVRWLWATWQAQVTQIDARRTSIEKIKMEFNRYKEAAKEYLKYERSDEEKEAYQPIEKNWPEAERLIEKAIALLNAHTEAGNREVQQIIITDLRPILQIFDPVFVNLSAQQNERMKKALVESEKINQSAKATLVTASGVGLFLLFLFAFLISNQLTSSLGTITSKITDSSSQVSSASSQLSASSQQLSSGATQGAASLEETVSSLEELSSMVKLNTDHAREAAELSLSGRASAEEGEKEMQQLAMAMSEITTSSKKIEEIITVIDDIAFQTNILALNAAVEAARAGEQGKGFAVVAEAVRTLAQQSGSAAKEISSLIKDSVNKIERGSTLAERSNHALNSIVTSIKKIADLNTEISSASQEQSTGLGQISKAMNQLDQATQGNAASAEEVAASSEEMSNQAHALQSMAQELAILVSGVDSIRDSGSYQRPVGNGSSESKNFPPGVIKFPSSRTSKLKAFNNHSTETQSFFAENNETSKIAANE